MQERDSIVPGRISRAVFQTASTQLVGLSAYCDARSKARAVDTLMRALQAALDTGKPSAIGGDFNLPPQMVRETLSHFGEGSCIVDCDKLTDVPTDKKQQPSMLDDFAVSRHLRHLISDTEDRFAIS